MKDFGIFGWSYFQFGSIYVYDERWHELMLLKMEKTNRWLVYCEQERHDCREGDRPRFDTFDILLNQSMGYVAGLWSRLAEVAIRTTFIVVTSTTALLFEELDIRIEKMAIRLGSEVDSDEQEKMVQLNEWRCHYDLLCQLVELINHSFGFILLIITGHDFAIAILDFYRILENLDVAKGWQKEYLNSYDVWNTKKNKFTELAVVREKKTSDYVRNRHNGEYVKNSHGNYEYHDNELLMRSDPIRTCKFVHPLLRFLLILVTSNNLGSKVLQLIIIFLYRVINIDIFIKRQTD